MTRITAYGATECPLVLLANGQPAYTRDRRIWQADIDRYGSAEKARQAKEQANVG